MRDLTNKVAFVTGGASGIGLGIVQALLAHGVRVAIADLRSDHLDEARSVLGDGPSTEFLEVDVIDRTAMADAADRVVQRFGAVHILVNNAGVGTAPTVEAMRYEDWDWVLGVNLGGVVNGIMSFLPHMLRQNEGGHIVSTSSMAGLLPSVDNFIYAASKYAIRGLGDSLRLSLAPHGIGVSTLYPGLTRSRMLLAEQNRQVQFGTGKTADQPVGAGGPTGVAGMDPREMGDMVVHAILKNEGHILSHSEFRGEVAENYEELLSAFPVGQEIGRDRLEFQAMIRERTNSARAAIDRMNGADRAERDASADAVN
ncbi:SDR family oxidoreductase [Streptomyces sp. BK205]|uniref:SDR family oxidoreductase n=1 Tax=Streptomyces sp. BK205 TaxID=2512164 RepID=UPI00104A1D82|nr:SDR family oxidoreductase [Streptomyces sp. BK205]TCR26153.1 NADP-dependent 3-hydroxy acid dehydrogenase YdfG [Streptomyces sp. BK205]